MLNQVAPGRQWNYNRSSPYNMTVRASDTVNPELFATVDVVIFVDGVKRPAQILKFLPVKGVTAVARGRHQRNNDTILVCDEGSCSKPIHLRAKVQPILQSMRSLAIFNQFFGHFLTALTSHYEINPQLSEEQLTDRVLTSILHNATILIQITDNIAINTSLGVLSVAGNKPLRFSISNNRRFHLDPAAGSLFIRDHLDPGVPYSFTARVADASGSTSETSITVQAMRLKCQDPVFQRSLYEIDVVEGEYDEMPLAHIAARNGDCGKASR